MATGTIKTPWWKLIWTNPNPSSAFAAQTVPLSLSQYTEIKIVAFRNAAAPSNAIVAFSVDSFIDGLRHWIAGLANPSAEPTFGRRFFTPSSTGISFETAQLYTRYNDSAGTDNNNIIIPYMIYAR